MPTNVTPEYKKAEEAYRNAREPKERLVCLKEMLRTIPKHKGTDHLQADIKTRIKQLTEELAAQMKDAVRETFDKSFTESRDELIKRHYWEAMKETSQRDKDS